MDIDWGMMSPDVAQYMLSALNESLYVYATDPRRWGRDHCGMARRVVIYSDGTACAVCRICGNLEYRTPPRQYRPSHRVLLRLYHWALNMRDQHNGSLVRRRRSLARAGLGRRDGRPVSLGEVVRSFDCEADAEEASDSAERDDVELSFEARMELHAYCPEGAECDICE